MLKKRTVILLCSGFFVVGFVSGLLFVGFTSILIPSTHATGYSQSISTDLSPLLTPTPCLTPTPSPTPSPSPTLAPTPPVLSVASNALVFTVTQGGTSTSQVITIGNTGGGQLDWTATVRNSFQVSISPNSGSLAGGGAGTITVVANAHALVPGTYSNQITISAVDHATGQSVAGSPSFVSIHITILPSRPTPSLKLSPIPSPSPSPTLCLTPLPTPSPTPSPSPTPEEGLGLVQK